MARITIDLPQTFLFNTDIPVLIGHINRANHLANENLVALLNEARTRFMAQLPLAQNGIDPANFINADLAVIYQAEAHYGDTLRIDVGVGEFNRYGLDIIYQVRCLQDNRAIAIAKTAMLQFNYQQQQLQPINDSFKEIFSLKPA